MKGLELARKYYEAYGAPMIAAQFGEYADRIACGLAGEGSECFGFDDEYSQDHDFGPSFCMWLTDEDMQQIGGKLQPAYDSMPKSFRGFAPREESEGGAGRVGAQPTSLFYRKFTGLADVPKTLAEWRRIPEQFLAAATNGEVFADPLGNFTRIREGLLGFYPEDIRLKKITARAATMGQAGQYNYMRCVRRGEYVAAHCALAEFIRAACSITYLLHKKYTPFYKWAHRGLRDLDPEMYGMLAGLCGETVEYDKNEKTIEDICLYVIIKLKEQQLSECQDNFMLEHCGHIMQKVCDPDIRAMHIMSE